MQAIVTKYLPPTNNRGSRYKASCARLTITRPIDHALDIESNHVAACLELRQRIAKANAAKYNTEASADPWLRPMVCGQLPDGTYAHVFA